ncbi:MAG: tRNA (adenosine(37)-N6)-threonylcarbamoyltransferase complex ATPase subunit type 1 TsaE [Candidatus Saccharimonadales bacterium]
MSTVQTWQTISTDLEDTLETAMRIGRKLRGGEIIELVGDLGAGKTAFVRGLAKGMGSSDDVSSPSFTLGNRYRAGRLTLYHFDFHRLDEPGIMRRELAETVEDPAVVVVVEWADSVRSVIPDDRLTINITAAGENERRFNFTYPQKLRYLIPE